MAAFRRLLALSVLSVNAGYTLFLFPVLGLLYPDRVPLTILNLSAFLAVNTAWGMLLAATVYLMTRLLGVGVSKAAAWSILLLWAAYWLVQLLAVINEGSLGLDHVIIACTDGVAALVTAAVMLGLARRFAPAPKRRLPEAGRRRTKEGTAGPQLPSGASPG